MKLPNGTYGKIIDHPLGRFVHDTWNEKLRLHGLTYVYQLTKEQYEETAKEIDRYTENWFKYASPWEVDNLLNAWNYQGRHLREGEKSGA